MAAEYGININVRTKDEKLKQLQKTLTTTERKVKALQKELDQLSKKTGKGPGSGGPFSKDAIAKAKELTQKTKEAQIAFERYTKGGLYVLPKLVPAQRALSSLKSFLPSESTR